MIRVSTGRVQDLSILSRVSAMYPIDVTRKSGNVLFAPTWKMIWGVKNGEISWRAYAAQYGGLMAVSLHMNPNLWAEVLRQGEGREMVLCCYCKDPTRCHRVLLADILVAYGSAMGMDMMRGDEV